MNDNQRTVALAGMLIAMLLVAAYPTLTSDTLRTSLRPIDVFCIRFGIAGLVFLPLVFYWSVSGRRQKGEFLWGSCFAIIHGVSMGLASIWGLSFAPAAHQVVISPTSLLLTVLFLRDRGTTPSQTPFEKVSVWFSICGTGVLVANVLLSGTATQRVLLGDLLFVVSGVFGGINAHLVSKVQWPALKVAAYTSSLTFLLAVLPLAGESIARLKPLGLISLLPILIYQGILIGVFVSFAIAFALRTVGARTVGIVNSLMPVFGLGFAMVFDRYHRMSSVEYFASLLILLGVGFKLATARSVKT